MKITLFTSNQRRHNFLINLLSKNCKKLFVVQECTTVLTGKKNGLYKKNKLIEEYFLKVKAAENKIFKDYYIKSSNKINLLPLQYGDLNYVKIKDIEKFLKSDLYIVFGSSFIKGNLLKYLIKKKAINIHMGISPYYKGSDCNFWALYDGNTDLVGATIHMLSKDLDGGKILFHAISEYHKNPYLYSMSTVKSAFIAIIYYIIKKRKFFKPKKQNFDLNIKFSKRKQFQNRIISQFNKKIISYKKIRNDFFINKFVLKKKDFFN